MFKINNKYASGVFIVNFEHISYCILLFLLLTLSRQMPTGISYNFNKFFRKASFKMHFRSAFRTQPNIYDGVFLFSQKIFIVDIRLGSKYVSALPRV